MRNFNRPHPARLLSLAIFFILIAIYDRSPVRTSADSRWSIAEAMSFIQGHDGNLSEYRTLLEAQDYYAIDMENGKPYPFFPIGASLLAVPFVAIATAVQPSFEERLKERVPANFEALVASFYGALAAVVFFRLVFDRWDSMGIALASTFIFALCTSMWSMATRALWQHGPLILMLVLAMLLLQQAGKRPALIQYVGLPLAAGFIIRPTALIPIAAITIYILVFYRPWFLRYAAGAVLVMVPWAVHNLAIYHSILPPYYQPGRISAASDMSEGMLGTLISPARGLFVYSPVLVLAFSGFAFALQESRERWLNLAFMVSAVGIWLVVSHWAAWWGGHTYGPRLMADALPFLAYFVSFNFPRVLSLAPWPRRAAILGVVVLTTPSLILHAEGALLYGSYLWNVRPQNVDQARYRLWDWKDPPFLRISQR